MGAYYLFNSVAEFDKITADWPLTRLAEIWNSFAGSAPFQELKSVQKFENRSVACARIYRAVERLAVADSEHEVPPLAAPKKSRAGSKTHSVAQKATQPALAPRKAERAPQPAAQSGANKREQAIALLRRNDGVSLDELVRTFGWQRHTVRGFISLLQSKGGLKIASTQVDGERVYKLA